MHTSKQLKICCALWVVMTMIVTVIASAGTSYARFVYTGEHKTVFYKQEEPEIESNIMFVQGCTVFLEDWDLNSSYNAQTVTASFSGKEANGRITCSIPHEYAEYYTVDIADVNGTTITENDEISVGNPATELKVTVTPVNEKIAALTSAVTAEALLTFTELTETISEDGTVTVSDGDKLTGTLKWNIIPLDEPVSSQPQVPTATVTEIKNENLIFALNFKADEVTAEQLDYYGSWYADFELKVNKDVTFNANGNADGWLSGQYDAWSENWVNVPFEDVTLAADTPLKIMEYAAELMGQPGLKYTYAEVYEGVKDFDCGVFFDKKYLEANPDLEVTLELRMYNPADENESYVIGKTYTYVIETPDIPTATVTEIENPDLTFALNFKANAVSALQLDCYGSWYADFELKVNKDVTFNANGNADGWLSGQYDAWSENWVNVPFENVTIAANTSLKIMEYAAELMGQPGLKYTYAEVYGSVKDFDCGVFFDNKYLAANPDLEVTLELRMYNPANENESYVIGKTYTFTADDIVLPAITPESAPTPTMTPVPAPERTEEPVMICEICDSSEHTTENCTEEINLDDTENTDNGEDDKISENSLTEEAETLSYSSDSVFSDLQIKTMAINTVKLENIEAKPMLITVHPVLTTVNTTPEPSLTTEATAENISSGEESVSASHISVIEDNDIITYTYITYPKGTAVIEVADNENPVEGNDITYVYSFAPYTQIHTEKEIYVLPFGNSFVIHTDPVVEGVASLKIVTPDAAISSEDNSDTEQETEPAPTPETKIYTNKVIKWEFDDGRTISKTSENTCYAVDGSDFDNSAPLDTILSSAGSVTLKTIPVKNRNQICTVEYYSNGTYTLADSKDFSINLNSSTGTLKINVGEHYPQAGIYRVRLQLQSENKLSAYYKTFFVNYR